MIHSFIDIFSFSSGCKVSFIFYPIRSISYVPIVSIHPAPVPLPHAHPPAGVMKYRDSI